MIDPLASGFVCTKCGRAPETTSELVKESIIPFLLTATHFRDVPVDQGWTEIESQGETVRLCPACVSGTPTATG